MEKTESKYRQTDENKSLSIDFSSELGRFVHLATPSKSLPRIPQLILMENTIVAENRDPVSDRNYVSHTRAPMRSFHFPIVGFRRRAAKISQFFPELKKISTSARFLGSWKSSLTPLRNAVGKFGKMGAEAVKILDMFFYLPLWVTMPAIFFASVVLGASLAIFFGF